MAKSRKSSKRQDPSEALPVAELDHNGKGMTEVDLEPPVEYVGDLEIEMLGVEDFDRETLINVFRTMLLSRRLDEKMITLLKQGKGFFHIGCAGHEAAQAAVGLYMKPGHDWFAMYYRDLCISLMLGQTSEQVMLAHLAKAEDPNSGGRQMAEHYGIRDLNIITSSSSVGAQYLPGLGMAMSMQRQGSDAVVYASSGEGATSQGDFHEAMNWAARLQAPVLFFVQDNKYAISVPVTEQTAGGSPYKLAAGYEGVARARVDGTNFFRAASAARAAVEHIRSGKGPVCLVADVVRLMPHSSSDNHTKYRTPEELEADRLVDPIAQMEVALIEGGILTEAQANELRDEVHQEVEEATQYAMSRPDPAPETAERFVYYEGNLDIDFEKEGTRDAGEPVVMIDAINHALHEEMEANDRVLVYGEDVAGEKGGVFTATRDLTARFGQDRCFNSPLAEASIIGTAVGLSATGYKPVVEIQFGDYIWPALQQLRNQVASFRYRSNNEWSCPMVIRVPVGGYIHGGLCHSQNIEATFGHMPGFRIALPSNAADAKGLLKAAIRMEDPVLFLEHKALYRAASARTAEPSSEYFLEFGKANVVKEGTDITIVTYGMMVHKALSVARGLEKDEGVSVEVIDLRTIVPLDIETVFESVKKTNRALVLYEDHEFLGFGSEIAAQISDAMFQHLDAPVKRVAGAFTPIPFADPLEKAVLPQDEDVLNGIRRVLEY